MLKQKYTVLGVFLSILFIYLAFRKVDLRALETRLESADLALILLALLPLSASYIIRTFLWRTILQTFKNVDFSNTFSALMIGFFANNVLPGRVGEFIRAYILGRRENVGKTSVLGTIVVERLFDIFTLLIFLMLTVFVFPTPEWVKHVASTTSVILLTAVAVSYLFVLRQNFLVEKFKSKMFFLSKPKKQFFTTKLDSFISGLKILKTPRLILTIFVLSLLAWLLASMSMLLTFKSLHINVPTIYGPLFVLSVVNLGLIVPSSPGYVGTYQFLCVIALSYFSVDKESALSFSIIHHALWYLPLTIVGMIFLWRENLSLTKLGMIKQEAGKIV
ncbi:MAG TPA: lysylphosphatidylglycerol synthase transmembrane domain-containing protein [Thermodesulfobacteriota bacterium]|nr:lysylphosphatidylglycerol synthase transmembrane domain-containing protein [Thermodesulfobacteriota bacterium]